MIGVTDRSRGRYDEAAQLSAEVLNAIRAWRTGPDPSAGGQRHQRMSKRDELLGLNEFLARLAKCLMMAETLKGHQLLVCCTAIARPGACIVTALATGTLVALPGAEPEVMDLPSMSRVTKLSIEILEAKAKSTPVFAPGLKNLAQTGAVLATWDEKLSLADQLEALLADVQNNRGDQRDRLGQIAKDVPRRQTSRSACMTSHFNQNDRKLRRHDLIFVSPVAWRSLLQTRDDLTGKSLIIDWADRGWPLVARRAMPCEKDGVALGLPLPPFAGKRRISLLMRPEDIVSTAPPLELRAAISVAPEPWQHALQGSGELGFPAKCGGADLRQPGVARTDGIGLSDRGLRSRPSLPPSSRKRSRPADHGPRRDRGYGTHALGRRIVARRWRERELARAPCKRAPRSWSRPSAGLRCWMRTTSATAGVCHDDRTGAAHAPELSDRRQTAGRS